MVTKRGSLFGINCMRRDYELIAPHETEYLLDTKVIRHFWHRPKCHARFESLPRFPPDVRAVKDLIAHVDVFPSGRG